MKSLITGGAGFIGSHLSEALLSQGRKVNVVDNLSTGRLENIQHLQDKPDFSFAEGDILDESLMENLIAEADEIYHLAEVVGMRFLMEHGTKAFKTSVYGTEMVLKLASRGKKKGCQRIICPTLKCGDRIKRIIVSEGEERMDEWKIGRMRGKDGREK